MNRRYARKIVFGAWLLLVMLMPWSAQAQQPATDPLAPEIAPAAAPSCARWTATHIDCFVIGSDNRIWMIQWNDDTEWGGWTSVPQPAAQIDAAGGLSVTVRGAQVDIFVSAFGGGIGDLYRLTWTGFAWTPWENLGHPATAGIFEVACAARSATSLDCFARGSDNHLWQRAWNGASWGAWTDLGAFPSASAFGGLAAATWSTTNLVVYAIGGDNHAYRRYYSGGAWSSWLDDGQPAGIGLRQVGCAALDVSTIECAFTDIDGGAWYRRWTSAGGWAAFTDLAFPPSYARGVTVANFGADGVVVLANASDGRFYRKFRDPGLTTWSNWIDLGRPKDVRMFIPNITN
jgi:hypothetical protein